MPAPRVIRRAPFFSLIQTSINFFSAMVFRMGSRMVFGWVFGSVFELLSFSDGFRIVFHFRMVFGWFSDQFSDLFGFFAGEN